MNIDPIDLRPVLAARFPAKIRLRGAEIQTEGMVSDLLLIGDAVHARVLGTHLYEVELPLTPDPRTGDIRLSCTCPAFDRLGPCKHLWAVVLEITEQLKDGGSLPEPRRQTGADRLHSLRHEMQAEGPDPWAVPTGNERQLRYVIDVASSARDGALVMEIRMAKRSSGEEWGPAKRYDPYHYSSAPPSDPLDRRLLHAFAEARAFWSSIDSPYPVETGPGPDLALEGLIAPVLLGDLCATGRLYWEDLSDDGGPLVWDDGVPWSLRAGIDPHGDELELTVWLERGEERLAIEEPLLLFETGFVLTRTTVAHFEHQGCFRLAAELRRNGPLRVTAEEQAELLSTVLNLPAEALTVAPDLPPVEAIAPIPHLRVAPTGSRSRTLLGCAVQFDYGGSLIEPEDDREVVASRDGTHFLRRDREAEKRAVDHFLSLGGRRAARSTWHDEPGSVDARRFPMLVRGLLRENWTVEAENLRWRAPGTTSVSVASGVDWFDLSGTVSFGDQVASLPDILAAARAGRDTVTLGDGSQGVLPERWLETWSLLAFGETEEDHVRFQANQAWLLDALLEERENVVTDAGFEVLRKRLAGFEGVVPRQEPSTFHGELRPYQREGLGWLDFLETLGIGGCLADDMGLGKTIQVLAYLEQRRVARLAPAEPGEAREPRRPTLVVAPRSLVFNWIDEAARFTPELTTLDYTGNARRLLRESLHEHDLVLTTYGTLRRDAAYLAEIEFDCVVLDEAQAIKNGRSQTAKAARVLRTDRRLALSGTPIENHIGELWSLFEFLNPGMLGGSRAFNDLMTRGTSGELDPQLLGRALRPFFLRRRKEEVLDDLPPKTEQVLHCVLPPKERKRYDDLRDHFRASLLAREQEVGLGRMKIHVLEALLRLRQAACHPALLDPSRSTESSAKLDALMPRLEEVAEEGHKALVFSQFTSFLALVRPHLDAAGIPYEYLDGGTRDRKSKVDRFQNDPDCPLFLISIKAGGHGLNLTAADYVFLLDPWWNPAVESQAIDRAHRIGRTRPVVAYRLIAEDTIEERVQELQTRKRALASALFDEGSGTGLRDLTREDLERLFA